MIDSFLPLTLALLTFMPYICCRFIKYYNMKQLLKLLFLFVMLLSGAANAVAADDGTAMDFKKTKPRPRSIVETECNVSGTIMSDGTLVITFAEPEGDAVLKLTRLDDDTVATARFSTAAPYEYRGIDAPGAYLVTITTSFGCEYEALLEIN